MPASQSFSADQQSPSRLHTWRTTLVRPGPGPPPRLHGRPVAPPWILERKISRPGIAVHKKFERKAAIMGTGTRGIEST